jgi:hypothetical protein
MRYWDSWTGLEMAILQAKKLNELVNEGNQDFSTIPARSDFVRACCLSYPSSMVKWTSFISLISVITIA